MKYIVGCLLALSFSLSVFAQEESCDCPKLGCDPCSISKGLTFYTSKCGPGNTRLKSCGRPTCIAIEQATKECPVLPSASKGPREPVVLAAERDKADPNADTKIVGGVKVISGSVSITHADGKKLVVESGEARVRETDVVESSKDGTAVVTFDGGNKLHVHQATAVEVKEYKDPADPVSRKVLLQLIKGKIRNQVNQKYNGKTTSYRVTTSAAVAGVRGTDFVMEHSEDGKLETKVETLGGHVLLASLDEKELRDILKGEGAKFSADLPDPSFKGKDYSEFIQRGKLSPVYKITAEEMEELESSSRVDVAKNMVKRKKPVKEVEICKDPKGFFDQCAWKCVGNPGGEKTCRTDLPQVSCMRSRCNANGQWADETKLAPKTGTCPPVGFAVKACDY
ncbi:MAG: FecR domain-containing protein [Bdellovibrionales bacterium]|nr:FecR domain-containing protein [Bdellovibrionales bacterium]